MRLGRQKRSTSAVAACIVCRTPVDGDADARLCSRACLVEARRELDENLAVLRQGAIDTDVRASLIGRNGELTAALIRWSP